MAWVQRKVDTGEIVQFADQKPTRRQPGEQGPPLVPGAVWEDDPQVISGEEEIVWVDTPAEEMHQAIKETVELVGEVSDVKLVDGEMTMYPSTPAEILAEARKDQERKVRLAANAEDKESILEFEGRIVAAKYGRGGITALNADEKKIFDESNNRYNKLVNLVGQIRSAPLEVVRTLEW